MNFYLRGTHFYEYQVILLTCAIEISQQPSVSGENVDPVSHIRIQTNRSTYNRYRMTFDQYTDTPFAFYLIRRGGLLLTIHNRDTGYQIFVPSVSRIIYCTGDKGFVSLYSQKFNDY